jgi:hypothetical protein
LLVIGFLHLVESDTAVAGVVDLRADRSLLRGGTDRACNEAGPVGRTIGELVAGEPSHFHGLGIHLADQLVRQLKLFHADRTRTERVRLNDVGPCGQIASMYVGHGIRMRQAENIGEIFKVFMVAGESIAADGSFIQSETLDLRAHSAIQQQDALGEK